MEMNYIIKYGNEHITITHCLVAYSMREAIERLSPVVSEKGYKIYSVARK